MQLTSDYLATKQKTYIALILRIRRMLIYLLKADSGLREQQGARQHGKKVPEVAIARPLLETRPSFLEGEVLDFLDIALQLQQAKDDLLSFWRATRWKPGGSVLGRRVEPPFRGSRCCAPQVPY